MSEDPTTWPSRLEELSQPSLWDRFLSHPVAYVFIPSTFFRRKDHTYDLPPKHKALKKEVGRLFGTRKRFLDAEERKTKGLKINCVIGEHAFLQNGNSDILLKTKETEPTYGQEEVYEVQDIVFHPELERDRKNAAWKARVSFQADMFRSKYPIYSFGGGGNDDDYERTGSGRLKKFGYGLMKSAADSITKGLGLKYPTHSIDDKVE